jgi:GntR family transcriptional regulator, transcriptional repressor for pyruvate dehydrogenase complex
LSKFALLHVHQAGSIVSQIVNSFKESLINGQLKPGQQIPPEPELCEQFGVSRTSVREAIKALSAVGLVEIRRGNGTFISAPSLDTPLELLSLAFMLAPTSKEALFGLRSAIEHTGARLVIANATPEDIEGLKAQTREFEQAIVAKMTAKQLRVLDLQFHKLLLDATHNPMFSRLGQAVMTAFASAMQKALNSSSVYEAALKDHQEIIDAIIERSNEKFAVVTDRSLATWERYIGQEPPQQARNSKKKQRVSA